MSRILVLTQAEAEAREMPDRPGRRHVSRIVADEMVAAGVAAWTDESKLAIALRPTDPWHWTWHRSGRSGPIVMQMTRYRR